MGVRRVVAAVAVVGLAASGCSSQPPGGELELEGDDAAAAPVTPDPPVETPEEALEPPEEEQLYPPLPPLEPDPNSDIPIEDQQFFLELHAQVYGVGQRAYASGSADGSLGDHYAGTALEEIEDALELWKADGVVQRSPDSTVEWVEVIDLDGGEFAVDQCVVIGPETGLYDAATGEAVEVLASTQAAVIRTTYGLIDVDGAVEYRAVNVEAGADDSRCHVG